jgi:hypothetical protein
MTECAALIATEAFVLVVEPQQAPVALIAAGDQGPAGADGVDGAVAELPTDPLAYYILART